MNRLLENFARTGYFFVLKQANPGRYYLLFKHSTGYRFGTRILGLKLLTVNESFACANFSNFNEGLAVVVKADPSQAVSHSHRNSFYVNKFLYSCTPYFTGKFV